MHSPSVPIHGTAHHQDEVSEPSLEELENDDSSNGANQEVDPGEEKGPGPLLDASLTCAKTSARRSTSNGSNRADSPSAKATT